MSRPTKQGIPFFSLDCEMDSKTELYCLETGAAGFGVLVCIWQLIYSNEGYYIKFDDDLLLLVRKRVIADINEINVCINSAIKRGIFDANMAESGILTSSAIQKRYFDAAKRKKSVRIYSEYLLVDPFVYLNVVNVNINSINADINAIKEKEKEKEDNANTNSACASDENPSNLQTQTVGGIRPLNPYDASVHIPQSENPKGPIPEDFTPNQQSIHLLTFTKNIPQQFIDDCLTEFVMYWRERLEPRNDFQAKFRNRVINQWERQRGNNEGKSYETNRRLAQRKAESNHARVMRQSIEAAGFGSGEILDSHGGEVRTQVDESVSRRHNFAVVKG